MTRKHALRRRRSSSSRRKSSRTIVSSVLPWERITLAASHSEKAATWIINISRLSHFLPTIFPLLSLSAGVACGPVSARCVSCRDSTGLSGSIWAASVQLDLHSHDSLLIHTSRKCQNWESVPWYSYSNEVYPKRDRGMCLKHKRMMYA